ncbi:hypothetical protein LSTR_LSTR014231 [Laodelphax striatellus]|uniref:CCHC-type domain-containing protein n=1 Tax=Laodelphax striatellus TaxID=195883 RepID=A0A482XSG8_LAOST|nr:hypothetical protein LSTR_LSTR014231 [Laodelphax striatellus]
MFGRTLKSSIAVDNGRSAEFIRRKSYPDKSRCYECGEEGHLSYACPTNLLGERPPPPKKERKRKKNNGEQDKNNAQFYDDSDDDDWRDCTTKKSSKPNDSDEDDIPDDKFEPDDETLILGGEDKLIVDNPLRSVIQASGWMKLYYLIILYRQIMSGSF